MLQQRLVGDRSDHTGTLTITAGIGALPELEALQEELRLRMNMETMVSEIKLPPVEDEQPPNG